jgi:hypothetical protein
VQPACVRGAQQRAEERRTEAADPCVVGEDGQLDARQVVVTDVALAGNEKELEIGGDGAPRIGVLRVRCLGTEERAAQEDCSFLTATTTRPMTAMSRIRRFMVPA